MTLRLRVCYCGHCGKFLPKNISTYQLLQCITHCITIRSSLKISNDSLGFLIKKNVYGIPKTI